MECLDHTHGSPQGAQAVHRTPNACRCRRERQSELHTREPLPRGLGIVVALVILLTLTAWITSAIRTSAAKTPRNVPDLSNSFQAR